MSTTIELIPDSTTSGNEELIEEIRLELNALEIGELETRTEKAKEGTLAIDIVTVGVIINGARLTLDLIKGIISIVKEIQLRYADKKNIDLQDVPKVKLRLGDPKTHKENIEIQIPSSKSIETRFLKKVSLNKGNKK
jgi:hypothetical protein